MQSVRYGAQFLQKGQAAMPAGQEIPSRNITMLIPQATRQLRTLAHETLIPGGYATLSVHLDRESFTASSCKNEVFICACGISSFVRRHWTWRATVVMLPAFEMASEQSRHASELGLTCYVGKN